MDADQREAVENPDGLRSHSAYESSPQGKSLRSCDVMKKLAKELQVYGAIPFYL